MSRTIVNLPADAKAIKGAVDHWIDPRGNVYSIDHRNRHRNDIIIKAQTTCHGYKYCGIRFVGQECNIQKRVHRLVADAFLSNPNNYPVVGHKNNIKSDNRVENLYWTTISENTQKAFDDGLAKNDSGIFDSQSFPCAMYNRETNQKIGEFGSIIEASKLTGVCKSTIARQCKYGRPVRKPFYFRYINGLNDKCESTIENH